MTLYFPYRAVLLDDPYSRLKAVVKWYLSGFYKKPKVHNCLNECICYAIKLCLCAFLLIIFFFYLFVQNIVEYVFGSSKR